MNDHRSLSCSLHLSLVALSRSLCYSHKVTNEIAPRLGQPLALPTGALVCLLSLVSLLPTRHNYPVDPDVPPRERYDPPAFVSVV
ncbi:hypothetical protein C8Q77DRAFT_1092125 [Trametes polyzona]|nr:hypothetical protein C8Q77DRAFT_1092125 [Trametes polyzona]